MEGGGILILGYEMYRNLSTLRNVRKKKMKETLTKCLVTPGKVYETDVKNPVKIVN